MGHQWVGEVQGNVSQHNAQLKALDNPRETSLSLPSKVSIVHGFDSIILWAISRDGKAANAWERLESPQADMRQICVNMRLYPGLERRYEGI